MLIRSDSVSHLTEPGRAALAGYGVTTVLDLRSEGELARDPSPFGTHSEISYVHRELIDDGNMNNIVDARDMLERYVFVLETRKEAFRDVFTSVAEADGTVLFHCFAGKDRTGVVAAMLLELASVNRDQIAADYGATDVQLAPMYETWIAEAPPEKRDDFRAELQCPPERILGVLDHLDREWGGVDGYLEAAGVKPSDVDRLRSRLE